MPPNEPTWREAVAREFSYVSGAASAAAPRAVAVESPVNLVFGGVPFAVMMATPADLEDFAYGFCLTEGIVERVADIRAVEVERTPDGLRLNVALASERLAAHLARGRAMSGRTGCGICGIADLASLPKPRAAPKRATPVAPAAIGAALRALEARQPLNDATRAVHAAAWCDREGTILCVREDVGRHNALDKAIGAMARAGADPLQGFFVITSRCSFEMVAKAAAFGAQTLVALSAPTSLALERARDCGVTLVAVARRDHALSLAFAETSSKGGLAA